ncbi:MAG: hypothetical protein P8016_05945 [Sedimentisphaerales bacterium]|jgi:hypothetical protein
MTKSMILLAAVALVAAGTYVVFAADQPAGRGGGMTGGGGMMGGGMMGGRGGYGGMMTGRGMMMSSTDMMMANSTMVAIPDGVIVMMGNQLLKYDNDLNLVKQVEIKFDWDSWEKTMAQRRNAMMQNQQ